MNQKGFTMIELLVALPISAVLLGAIVGAIFMVTRGTTNIRNEMIVQADMENTVHWLTRDIYLGQSTDLVSGAAATTTANFTWTDYAYNADNQTGTETSHYVVYTYSGNQLQRKYDSTNNVTVAGKNLSAVSFKRYGDLISVSLTSSYQGAVSNASATRQYFIKMQGTGE